MNCGNCGKENANPVFFWCDKPFSCSAQSACSVSDGQIDRSKERLSHIFRSNCTISMGDHWSKKVRTMDEETFIAVVSRIMKQNAKNEGLDAPEGDL